MSTIKTKNSTTPSAVPSAASLSQGELAVNIADKKLFVGNASGDPVELTNQGVLSINGVTGAITNVAFTNVDNNFSVGQTFASDIAVNGGDLTSNQTTFNLLNSTVTTLNVGGAASSTINIGATDGTSTIDLNSNLLKEVEFRNYFETKATASTTTVGMVTYLVCDLSSSNVFTFSASEVGISGISVTNIPSKANTSVGFTIVITKGAGVSTFDYDVFVSGSVKWAGGTPPTYTTTEGNTDIISYVTYDGGTTWYGFVGGLNFS